MFTNVHFSNPAVKVQPRFFAHVVDTRDPNIQTQGKVLLPEPVSRVESVHVGSIMVPNALTTVVRGKNDTVAFVFAENVVNLVLTPGFYTAQTFLDMVTGLVEAETGLATTARLTPTGNVQYMITGAPADLAVSFQPTETTQSRYFGLDDQVTLSARENDTVVWTSPLPMVLTRTYYLTFVSDKLGKEVVGQPYRLLFVHPLAGVSPQGATWSSLMADVTLHVAAGKGERLSTFAFDVLDDNGRSVLDEFGQVPVVMALTLRTTDLGFDVTQYI